MSKLIRHKFKIDEWTLEYIEKKNFELFRLFLIHNQHCIYFVLLRSKVVKSILNFITRKGCILSNSAVVGVFHQHSCRNYRKLIDHRDSYF